MKTIIKNVHIVSPFYDIKTRYDILVEGRIISKIAKKIEQKCDIHYDGGGNTLIPGLVDMNCDMCEPGFEHIEGLQTGSLSALKGGFTSITCAPQTKPCIDDKTVVQYVLARAATEALVRVYPYGSMTVGLNGIEMSQIGEMVSNGIVAITDGGRPIENASILRNIFKYSLMFDLPVITFCEDTSFSSGVMHEGYVSTRLGLAGIPREAEEIHVARNIIMAENVGNRLHIAAVSTKRSVQLIREAKERGAKITCETHPQYFTLTENELLGYNTLAKVRPPLRTSEDTEAIKQGIADGTIDVIASGHDPSSYEHKEKEFDHASYGISALETALCVSYTELVQKDYISLETLMDKMSYNPAKILGLYSEGIKEGAAADFVVVDFKNPYIIDAEKFVSKAKFSPFNNMRVKGKIIYTVVDGNVVF